MEPAQMKEAWWREEPRSLRRGVVVGLVLVLFVTIAYLLAAPSEPKAKFHVGQVVEVNYDTATPQYFKVGYVDRETYSDGTAYFKYTDASAKSGAEWPEDSLRALTRDECK